MLICNVCLENCISTVSVQKSDINNVKWLRKLQDVIPELEWLEKYMICKGCTKQLEKAWEFKKIILDREKDRRNEIKQEELCLEGTIDRTRDITEYFSKDKEETNCDECLKTFTTPTQLYQHKLQIHNKNEKEEASTNIFTCYNCNDSFDIKENLIYHIETEHKETKIYSTVENFVNNENVQNLTEDSDVWEKLSSDIIQGQYKIHCDACSQSYTTEEMFQLHFKTCVSYKEKPELEINKKSRRYFCQECRANFQSAEEQISHNLSKHKQKMPSPTKKRRGRKPLRKFNCEMCNEEFDYVKLLIEHCTSVHAMSKKLVKPYVCEICDMRFVSSANLDQHRNYHGKNRTHICSLCGKAYITKSDLTVHEYTHYNRRNYKCTMCDKAFNTNKNLRTHNLVVHTDRSLWKYACSICEKRFPLKTNYDQHLRRHTGEKEHACHICKKPFISKTELQRHVHVHSNIRAFKCDNCEKEFKESRTYKAHLAKKHGIGSVKVTVREKKFMCQICPSQFYDKQKLTRHIYSHSGLKPFPCYACDKKFTDKSYLKHHLKTAHNIVEPPKIEEA